MAQTGNTPWSAEVADGELVLDIEGPMSFSQGLKCAERIVSLCGKGLVTNASKVATAAAPSGKGPKKPRKK